jgi:hypothetical protein
VAAEDYQWLVSEESIVNERLRKLLQVTVRIKPRKELTFVLALK